MASEEQDATAADVAINVIETLDSYPLTDQVEILKAIDKHVKGNIDSKITELQALKGSL